MINLLAIMAGGSIGAAMRHGIFLLVQSIAGAEFPAGTLAANLLGSFLIGFIWCVFDEAHYSHELRLFVFTGLLGGFTTFSTFTRETFQLFKVGEWKTALAYLTISNVFGILLVFCGVLLCKQLILMLR
ncbi:MAG: fluoride efflux transporter CrcB [Desulfobulbales bacterium]